MSEPMTAKRLEEITARAKKATPGPWHANPSMVCTEEHWLLKTEQDTPGGWFEEEDAEFIASSRQDVPDLVAALWDFVVAVRQEVDDQDEWSPYCPSEELVALLKRFDGG